MILSGLPAILLAVCLNGLCCWYEAINGRAAGKIDRGAARLESAKAEVLMAAIVAVVEYLGSRAWAGEDKG